ncbi:MAG: serine hydrolase domain-containing protein, partial [Bryobacteraceae bacterium]
MKAIAIFLTLGLSLHAAERIDASKSGMDPARLARIPVRMKAFVDKGTIAGSVTLVARHGQVVSLEAVGYTDIETKQPMRTDAIFQIHSMTKPMVAVGAMLLVEEGKLALGDPVEKYLPEFRGIWVNEPGPNGTRTQRRPARAITVRDLLTHTSGMPTNPPEGIRELHGALHKTLAETVAIESQQPIDFDPGTKWQYSNNGIAAVALILERLSGMPFEKYLEVRIFQPLGMKDSYIYPPEEKYSRIPTAYKLEAGKPKKYYADPLGEGAMKYRKGAKYPLPEGGVYATAADIAAFQQMMLNGGTLNGKRLLSRASVATMTSVHTGAMQAAGPGIGYGLGFAIVRDSLATLPLAPVGTFFHGGRYGTYGWVDPKNDVTGVFMI